VHEKKNLLAEQPERVKELRAKLEAWCAELVPPGFPQGRANEQELPWYHQYLNLTLPDAADAGEDGKPKGETPKPGS
jgi:hypothetical protein